MKKTKKHKRKWPVLIYGGDYELVIACDDKHFVEHLKNNDPCTAGYVELTPKDDAKVKSAFENDPGCAFVGIVGWKAWNSYASQLGLEKHK